MEKNQRFTILRKQRLKSITKKSRDDLYQSNDLKNTYFYLVEIVSVLLMLVYLKFPLIVFTTSILLIVVNEIFDSYKVLKCKGRGKLRESSRERKVLSYHSLVCNEEYFLSSKYLSSKIKVILEMVFALHIIVFMSLFFLVIGILLNITSNSTIIYKQKRIGKDNKQFVIYKYRTIPKAISIEEDLTLLPKTISTFSTSFQNFLRITGIDEFPQMINIMKKEMSLIGPRPEQPKYANQYIEKIPNYSLRHLVLPGISGVSQISNLRGECSIEDRLNCDLSYILNWSLYNDFVIFIRTFIFMLKSVFCFQGCGNLKC